MTASRLVEVLLSHAFDGNVSDLSIEPSEHEARVRYRHDGVLRTVLTFPLALHAAVTEQLKKMVGLDLHARGPQTGTSARMLVSVLPVGIHERLTLRFSSPVPADEVLRSFGYGGEHLKLLAEERDGQDKGMLLLAAPRGHGKTAALESLRRFFEANEPVVLDGLDDDVLAESAIHAAAMNRTVLAAIPDTHVHDGYLRLGRISPAYVLSHGLRIGIRQQLVRMLCAHCTYAERLSGGAEKRVFQEWKKLPAAYRDREVFDRPLFLWESLGCARCGNTGYRGRLGVLEVFRFTDAIKASLGTKRANAVLEREIPRQGSLLFRQDMLLKALEGAVCKQALASYYSCV